VRFEDTVFSLVSYIMYRYKLSVFFLQSKPIMQPQTDTQFTQKVTFRKLADKPSNSCS